MDGLRAKGQSGPTVDGWGFAEVKPLFAGADLVVVNLECPFTARGAPIPKNFNFRARPSTVSGAGGRRRARGDARQQPPHGLRPGRRRGHHRHARRRGHRPLRRRPHAGRGAEAGHRRGRRARRSPSSATSSSARSTPSPRWSGRPRPPPASPDTRATGRWWRGWCARTWPRRRKQADLVIPFFHWGREGSKGPDAYQLALAKAAIDSGAAAVLGSHPHVLHGMERMGQARGLLLARELRLRRQLEPAGQGLGAGEGPLRPERLSRRGAHPAPDGPLPRPAHPALPAHRRRCAGGAAAAPDRVGRRSHAAAGARAGLSGDCRRRPRPSSSWSACAPEGPSGSPVASRPARAATGRAFHRSPSGSPPWQTPPSPGR